MKQATITTAILKNINLEQPIATDINVPDIPEKTSELTNDSGFLTEHQSLSDYATLSTAKDIAVSAKTDAIAEAAEDAATKDQALSGTLTDWVNSQNYLTEHQDITGKVDKIDSTPINLSAYTINEYLKFLTEKMGGSVIPESNVIPEG